MCIIIHSKCHRLCRGTKVSPSSFVTKNEDLIDRGPPNCPEVLASSIWIFWPIELCGWTSLYPVRHASNLVRASSRLKNHEAFGHSSRNDPLNDSIKAFSVGLPGREKYRVTPFSKAQRSSALLVDGWNRDSTLNLRGGRHCRRLFRIDILQCRGVTHRLPARFTAPKAHCCPRTK